MDSFKEKLPKPLLGNETKGEFITFGAFHESFHLGQIHMLKRLVAPTQ